jgi:hypothetical protein
MLIAQSHPHCDTLIKLSEYTRYAEVVTASAPRCLVEMRLVDYPAAEGRLKDFTERR